MDWADGGANATVAAGPLVTASANGTGGYSPVFLGNGASYEATIDLRLPLNGLDWSHVRVYSSASSVSQNWQGENWWGNEMINITGTAGDEDDNDCDVEMNPHYTFHFTNTATGTWTTDDNFLYTLTYSSGDNEFSLTHVNGEKLVFHDLNVANVAGRLKELQDAYGNTWTYNYSGSDLDYIDVSVVEGSDHRITYTYFTSGDNDGLLQNIKAYKTTTATDANLIGEVEYVYHSSASDGDEEFGSEDDLMKVVVSRKATNDGDGTLSIQELYYYRYYEGEYDSSTNPGTDHQLRYVLLPENADRLNTAEGDPLTQTNSDFEDYANVRYRYDANSRVKNTDERMPGSSCGCGGAGGSPATTSYTWVVNGGTPDLDTWKIRGHAFREDGTRIYFIVNRWYQILSWVIQEWGPARWPELPTLDREFIWHFDYGTSGASENRLTAIYNPSACSAFSTSAPYTVTLRSSDGVVHVIDYDYSTDTYDGFPEKIQIKKGTGGTADTLIAYGRTISERPDLATSITEYESGSEGDGRTTTLAHTFYDSGGDKVQLKQLDTTYPSVSSAKNGPGAAAVVKQFFDKRTGDLRWTLDGEGYVNFHAYDIETGVQDLTVVDANTSSLMAVITANWKGIAHGGFDTDAEVPFSRTGGGTALDIDSSSVIDWLGRTRKSVDAEGMITYAVYKDDETRVYPAWDTGTDKPILPIQISKTDKEGRAEDLLTLKTSVTPNLNGSSEPIGTESYANSDLASRTKNTYNISGAVSDTDRYHAFPASGDGTRYTHFYRTSYEYDDMGLQEYVITDVADETNYDREQVTRNIFDILGRRTGVQEGVSDNTHDISSGKPTLNYTVRYYFDDPDSDSTPEQGDGDGNLSWMTKYYSASYNKTEYLYDWRNRRCLTYPPLAPYTLVKFDNLNRATAAGTYSSKTGLDPGDDPATTQNGNRLSLGKTYYDERGRVYKTETYDDPGDATPGDELVTNTYRDRRGLVWATDAANTGISFAKYDGAGRRTETFAGTQFDSVKYTDYAPDYPDDDEGIVSVTEYTLDEVGKVTKTITLEVNHDDTDGLDRTNDDDYIRTFAYNWYDDAHRLADTAYYGTYNANGWKYTSTAPTRGSSAPARSDTILVTSNTYDSEGRRDKVTDPKGIDTVTTYDKLGRRIAETLDDGQGNLNFKIEYQYNGLDGRVRIIHDPDADNTFSNGTWTMVGNDTDQVTEYAYIGSQNSHWVTEVRYPTGDGTVGSSQQDKIVFTYNRDGMPVDRTDQNGTKLTWSYDALRRRTEEEVTTLGTYTGGVGAVDSAVRAFTWTYDTEGRAERVTSHTDTTPDTSSWTDATNQIKYTYNAADKLTKEEQEVDGAVDGSTLATEYSYGTDYTSSGNFKRKNYIEYPDGRKIWFGYTHSDTSNTFQDTINDKFNRPGQIARDNSGSIGDLLAEYDFNGRGRLARRVHDEASGMYGNDTKMDLWHGTTGGYNGLDRFGRIVDMKHTDFSGTPTDFVRRKYTHDRNGNRTSIEHVQYGADSQAFTYDELNRLTKSERGNLDSSSQVEQSDEYRDYNMDLVGNFTSTAGGVKINSSSSTVTHAVNSTNEITTLGRPNPNDGATFIDEPFTTSLSSFWTQDKGTWSISSNKVKVDSLTSGDAVLLADGDLDIANYEVEVTFPTGSSTNKAGIIFAHDGSNSYYAAVLDRNGTDKFSLHKITSGNWGAALDSTFMTINDSTAYTLRVFRKQRQVRVAVFQAGVYFTYDFDTDFGTGYSGLYSDKTDVTFDDFRVHDATSRDPLTPRIGGLADAELDSGELQIWGNLLSNRGGEAIVEDFSDADYMVQVTATPGLSGNADIWFRYIDSNNGYRVTISDKGAAWDGDLYVVEDGQATSLANTGMGSSPHSVKIKLSGSSIKVWVGGVLKFDETDSTHAAGGVAFNGFYPKFDNLKIGYDNNADDDIDDVDDDLVVNETFGSTDVTASHDHAGNLIDDGEFIYVYDAWNRLVEVRAKLDDVTIQTAEFDRTGRRLKKVVTNSGDYDKTEVYLYDEHKKIETRDGSGNMVQQFIHGTQYMDELVMMRVKDKGDLYVHQDANWNVIGLTDLGGNVVERNVYTPYGQLTAHQDTSYGDRDGDGDVDATDKGTPGTTCTGTVTGACRILDLDFDGDYDATDATAFDNLEQGLARHPGRHATGVDQPFGHQGLLYEAELAQYQNRHRQYDPVQRRFVQRDVLAVLGIHFTVGVHYADGMSLYGYLRNAPIDGTDVWGLKLDTKEACCFTEALFCRWRGTNCCPNCCECVTKCENGQEHQGRDPCHACGCCGGSWLLCFVVGGHCGDDPFVEVLNCFLQIMACPPSG